MSVIFSVRIPRELAKKMKKHREVNWSEVVRRSIEEYLERLEEARIRVSSREVLEELEELGVSEELLEPLDPEREKELYREMVEKEWKRQSMIRAR